MIVCKADDLPEGEFYNGNNTFYKDNYPVHKILPNTPLVIVYTEKSDTYLFYLAEGYRFVQLDNSFFNMACISIPYLPSIADTDTVLEYCGEFYCHQCYSKREWHKIEKIRNSWWGRIMRFLYWAHIFNRSF